MVNDLAQFALVLIVMTALAVVMGKWLTRVFVREHHSLPERCTYGLLGVNPAEAMSWKRYSMVLLSNAAMMLLGYFLLRIQGSLPFDSLQRAAQTPGLAFNVQYGGGVHYEYQLAGVLGRKQPVQLLPNGGHYVPDDGRRNGHSRMWRVHSRPEPQERTGYRQLLGRFHARDLLRASAGLPAAHSPLCMARHTANAQREVVATTMEGVKQHLLMGPVASLESIKHIGTNGGGFFGMNAAHPFENPTPLTNTLHMLSMLVIPAALAYTFGSMG